SEEFSRRNEGVGVCVGLSAQAFEQRVGEDYVAAPPSFVLIRKLVDVRRCERRTPFFFEELRRVEIDQVVFEAARARLLSASKAGAVTCVNEDHRPPGASQIELLLQSRHRQRRARSE